MFMLVAVEISQPLKNVRTHIRGGYKIVTLVDLAS